MSGELEIKLNFTFKTKEYLQVALIHKSYNEGLQKDLPNNEKLEFLGDSVINLIITDYLYRRFKNMGEGELSKMKAHLVSADFLFEIAKNLNLGDYVLLGKGEEKNNGRQNKKIVASLFEAIVGAIYLDSNLKTTATVILPFFREFLEKLLEKEMKINDYKSELQESIQKYKNILPVYRIVKKSGKPPNVIFYASVLLENVEIGKGQGRNKRQAEQDAAHDALEKSSNFSHSEKLSAVFFIKDGSSSEEKPDDED